MRSTLKWTLCLHLVAVALCTILVYKLYMTPKFTPVMLDDAKELIQAEQEIENLRTLSQSLLRTTEAVAQWDRNIRKAVLWFALFTVPTLLVDGYLILRFLRKLDALGDDAPEDVLERFEIV